MDFDKESHLSNQESHLSNQESHLSNQESKIDNQESQADNQESKIDSQESQADNEENKDTLDVLYSVSDSLINGMVWHLFSGSILFLLLSFISFLITEEAKSLNEFTFGLLTYIKIASLALGLAFLLSFFLSLFVLSKKEGMTIKEYINSLRNKYK